MIALPVTVVLRYVYEYQYCDAWLRNHSKIITQMNDVEFRSYVFRDIYVIIIIISTSAMKCYMPNCFPMIMSVEQI